ncbi:MAG: protein-disulfide reductase DsbD [Gammaproteobacteria bacterium]|nr:protein-disulfide reductase DsbD [Gammaproteobacteria bacterium]
MSDVKKRLSLLLLLIAGIWSPSGLANEEPLMPDDAFVFTAKMLDANTVRAKWHVVDKYYLYRDKINFTTDTPEISLGQFTLPPGKLKHGIKPDGTEGEVETYSGEIEIDIPIKRNNASLSQFTFIANSQGCAEIGICYPPHTQKAMLEIPAAGSSTTTPPVKETSGSVLNKLSSLSSSLGLGGNDDVLPPDEAFRLLVDTPDGNTVVARWQIADKHYLYQDKFNVKLINATGVKLVDVQIPDGEMKEDKVLNQILQVFHNSAEATVKLARTNPDPMNITLEFTYQGCAEEKGICYPPIKKEMVVTLPTATTVGELPSGPASNGGVVSEQDSIANALKTGGLLTIITFYGFGLLLAFTPCVFPMIPILSSIIVGQGEHLTTRRAFTMSLTYVLAMALTYTAAGVFAGLAGENLQAAFQNPWVLGTFAMVFVLLSLSMFGFYDLQLPSSWQSKLTEISNKQQGGSLVGVGIMGFLSALIVGPCVAAPLAGALIYIGQTGDAVLGGFALLALSLGMGTPLVAIGTSAGKLLPRAGGWMDAVKAVFGVMLLAVAIWMLERIIPAQVTMMLWAVLLIVSAIYLKALEPLNIESTGWSKFWKGTGLIFLVYGVLLMVGAATGGNDVMRPLHNLSASVGGGPAQAAHLPFKRIKSVADLQREVQSASKQGKPVMLDFYADWCTYCKDYERNVFPDPGVQKLLANVVLLQADVTDNDKIDKELLKHLSIPAPPAILFFDQSGQERRGFRLVGLKNAQEFRTHVEKAIK